MWLGKVFNKAYASSNCWTKESFLLIHIRNKFEFLQLLTESDVTECYHIKYLAYFLHFFTIDECRLNRGMESWILVTSVDTN